MIACVFGPNDSFTRSKSLATSPLEIFCDISWSPFSRRERKEAFKINSDKRNSERCIMLENIFRSMILCENYNNSKININIQIFQSDGCELAVCINAASYALIDAGIMVRDIVTACSATITTPTNTGIQNKSAIVPIPIVDPNNSELGRNPITTIALLSDKFVFFQTDNGKIDYHTLQKLVQLSTCGCGEIRELIRTNLVTESTKSAALQFI